MAGKGEAADLDGCADLAPFQILESAGRVLGLRPGEPRAHALKLVALYRLGRYQDMAAVFAGAAQFNEFLAGTRILVNLLPLTPDTRDIMRLDTLSRLQSGGYVINVARGAHLVDDDLLALLASGHLAGAMLDVFRTEPLPQEHPFWRDPKITITPHTSARTLRDESIAQIAGKIRALEAGQAIVGIVDPVRGY